VPAGKKGELAAAFRTFRSAIVGIGLFSAVSNMLMLTGTLFMLEIYDRVLPTSFRPGNRSLGNHSANVVWSK
jgi:ABC-type protease/lipase transport system fused ATPase/permease subunit